MEKAIEIFVALSLSVIALSHMLQSGVWVEFFTWLRERGYAGVFAFAFLCLNFGALVVAFHNVWHGWPMVFTIVGWGQVVKGSLYFVAPEMGMRWLRRVGPERANEFVIGGAILAVLCAAMWWVVLTQ